MQIQILETYKFYKKQKAPKTWIAHAYFICTPFDFRTNK